MLHSDLRICGGFPLFINTASKFRFLVCVLLAALFFLILLPSHTVFAYAYSVRVDTGVSLESALAAAEEQDAELVLEGITRLSIAGNGELSPEDGLFLRERLPSVRTLDLREFTGTAENAAFRGCVTLTTVFIPEHFVVSPEMFYGCSSLDEIVFPVHYQLSKDSFAYCALDFSDEYPSLLNRDNVLIFAAHQRPKVYFTMPNENRGTLSAGEAFQTPYRLETHDGSSYETLVQSSPDWLLTRPEDLEVESVIYFNDSLVGEVDTNQVGEYRIIYTLPYSTNATTHTQTYYLTVLSSGEALPTLLDEIENLESSHYTEESWQNLQVVLDEIGQENINLLSDTRQSALASALSEALDQLSVQVSGLPTNTVSVGQSFRLQPATEDDTALENWVWDDHYLSANLEEGVLVFTASNAGTTEVMYTSPNGQQGKITLTVTEESTASDAQDSGAFFATEYPPWLWTTTIALYIFIAFCLLISWYYHRRTP